MRRILLLSVLAAAVALPATPAAAKDGVRATLDAPVRLGPQRAGAIEVTWRLEDAAGRPFGASGIYLRVARCGRRPVRVPATEHGLGAYSARVRAPRRGIRSLVVGLKGWRIIGGVSERADASFPFDPRARTRCDRGSGRGHPPVDRQGDAGHVAARAAGQEDQRGGELLGIALALDEQAEVLHRIEVAVRVLLGHL
jgi:hypothetical protein